MGTARDNCSNSQLRFGTPNRREIRGELGHNAILPGAATCATLRSAHNNKPREDCAMATEKTDVVIVGVGAAGGVIAAELAEAGMKVIGLERGPRLSTKDFAP